VENISYHVYAECSQSGILSTRSADMGIFREIGAGFSGQAVVVWISPGF
jgi:hypothetical protein